MLYCQWAIFAAIIAYYWSASYRHTFKGPICEVVDWWLSFPTHHILAILDRLRVQLSNLKRVWFQKLKASISEALETWLNNQSTIFYFFLSLLEILLYLV